MIPALCINSSHKPSAIPLQEWINEGAIYHIKHVFFHPGQGVQGVELQEMRLTAKSHPYVSYRLDRFAIRQEDLQKLIELMKLCSELDEVDILAEIEKANLQIQE